METPEALDQFKQALAKYATGRLLHIAEAAGELKVSEKYLLDLARRGKIKSFKAGEHWFMEEKWLDDFREKIKKMLADETAGQHALGRHQKKWVRQLAPRPKRKISAACPPVLLWSFQAVAAAFVLAFVSLSVSLMCLPLAQVGLRRVAIADGFLNAAYGAYDLPLAYARNFFGNGLIDDESLTQEFYRLAGKNPPGQVAGEFEAGLK